MFLLISSVAHDTVSVNKEMGKSLALHLKNGEMNRNVVDEKEGVGQMKIESQGLLLQIARDAIACHLEDRIPSKLQGLDAELLQKSGAFVTLLDILPALKDGDSFVLQARELCYQQG